MKAGISCTCSPVYPCSWNAWHTVGVVSNVLKEWVTLAHTRWAVGDGRDLGSWGRRVVLTCGCYACELLRKMGKGFRFCCELWTNPSLALFFFLDASKDSKDWQWFLGCWTDVSLNEVASHNPLQGRGVPGNEAQAPTGGGAALSGEQERSPSSCAFLPPQARPWSRQVQPWEGGSPSWRKDLIPRYCGSLAILDTSGHWFCCGSGMFCLEWISRVPGGASTLCRGP